MLNCKQGDLAVIVRSTCGNLGKIVRCKKLCMHHWFIQPDGSLIAGLAWVVDPPVIGWRGDVLPGVLDAVLRPLRDNDGEDEMLRLAGLPVGAPQEA